MSAAQIHGAHTGKEGDPTVEEGPALLIVCDPLVRYAGELRDQGIGESVVITLPPKGINCAVSWVLLHPLADPSLDLSI